MAAPLSIQRMPIAAVAGGGQAEEQNAEAKEGANEGDNTSLRALLVDDAPGGLRTGQLTKGEFLAELRANITTAVEQQFKGTRWSTADCPWLDYWFDYYGARNAAHVESVIRKYAPEAADATTAKGYIDPVTRRVRSSVMIWMTTGRLTGIPEAPEGKNPVATPMKESAKIMGKARNGGFNGSRHPEVVRDQLGRGHAIDPSVGSRMSRALDHDFSDVRIHTDPVAHDLAGMMNARAFAVGNHVAFGRGEYRPGTMVGDGLIAHELAHVVQQRGSASASSSGEQAGLERDAEGATAQAITRMWAPAAGTQHSVAVSAGSGLQLQRCKANGPATPMKAPADYVMDAIDSSDLQWAFQLLCGMQMNDLLNACTLIAYNGRLDKLMTHTDQANPAYVSPDQMKRILMAMSAVRLVYSYNNAKLNRYPEEVRMEVDRLGKQIAELPSQDQEPLTSYLKYGLTGFDSEKKPDATKQGEKGVGSSPMQAGIQLQQLRIGTKVHVQIADYYISKNRSDIVLANYRPMTSVLKRLVEGYVKPKRSERPPELRLKPDITNVTKRELYEIKPISLVGLAKIEADMYLGLFHREGAMDMKLGMSANPGVTGTTTVDNVTYTFFSPMPGVIVYKAPDEEGEKERVREPASQPSAKPVLIPMLSPAPGATMPTPVTEPLPVFEPVVIP